MIGRRQIMQGAATLAAPGLLGAGAATAQPQAPTEDRVFRPARSGGPFWPDGARLVVSISMQFESGGQGDRAEGPFPPVAAPNPDTITPSWYAYGVNEGIPRLLDLWDRHEVQVTSHMIGRAVERRPDLAREIVERGHEAAAHGQTWTPHHMLSPDEERASFAANIAAVERATGTRPVGYNAYWMLQTPATLGILQDLGFIYHIDDLSRDEPAIVDVNGKPFAVVPYTARNNDVARLENPALTPRAFAEELKDEFDVLYAEAAYRRRMMSISTHDRVGGTPARVKALGDFIAYAKTHPGVVFMRKDAIARFALAQPDTPRQSG